ncbi:MAG: hypothetical protein GY757_11585 [bacterium]|nr:hypothetical protein [bacterium]
MAKEIIFIQNKKEYHFAPVKLDRKKLYGWRDVYAVDENDEQCELAYIDEYGTTIIPKGGLGLGILNSKDQWINRSELKAVDQEGKPVEKVPSTFSAPVELDKTVTIEEFLDHEITSTYALQSDNIPQEFIDEIANGPIYTFIFNYREDYEGDPAFLVENGGNLFILIGKPIICTYLSFQEAAEMEEITEEEDDDDLDFSMM